MLFAGIVHDLNNLLTVVNGYNELLSASHEIPEAARHYVHAARVAGQRAADLARALVTVGRTVPLEPQPFPLNDCVTELLGLVRHVLPASIEISPVLESDLRAVLADRCGVMQVLLNLVMNSRDAMPEGGRLEIETANVSSDRPPKNSRLYLPVGDYVLLAVKDNGAGMDEATRQRIFEPFYTTKSAGRGAGLGLPMVQHIVKRSGGFLSVESAPGAGTAVRIYLPAAEAGTPTTKAPTPAIPVCGGEENILVVEDDSDLRVLICDLLKPLGYTVLSAASAAEAVELADNFADRLHLLVTDVVLPDSVGTHLAAGLCESRPALKVLYLSGYTAESIPEEAAVIGVDLLTKPFSVAQLGERVREMLDRGRRKRVLFVDDDEHIVAFAAEVLRSAGYEVLTGQDGNEAISIAKREPLDLVITDLVMREREGLDTVMYLRDSHPKLPVVAISGAFGGAFLRSAAILGARATLAKPFSGDDLLETVRKVLGG